MQSNKVWAIVVFSGTLIYVSAATYKDPINLWQHWRVLYAASKINVASLNYYKEKLQLNDRAIYSAPTPWNITQKITMYDTLNIDSSFERARLKVVFNTTYEKEIAK